MVDPVRINVMMVYLSTGHNRKGKREANVVKQTQKQEEDLPSEGISLGSTFLPKTLSEIPKKATVAQESEEISTEGSKKCFGSKEMKG